ncbi:MAG: peptidylprolyl isomerase, partial [Bacteroidales bacterium]|nr:peptidylprolyl isomerase [Bacteroidales bacterium]
MKNKIQGILVTLLFIAASGTTLFAQRYEKGLIDKTIALIGNDMIQLSSLEQEVQMMMLQGVKSDQNIRCEVLQNMLTQKLFLTQARLDSIQVSPDNVEGELNRRMQEVLTQLGGEKAAEEYFKKPIFKVRDEWREALNEQFLTQEMRNKVAQTAPELTPSDVERFYRETPKDSLPIISTQYKYLQIALYPDKENSVLSVKERLLEFRDRIIKGERFSTLATLYSKDPGSAIRGGELGMASKTLYWPAFADAAMSLKEGQVSQIVETPDGFHLIQMIKKDGEMFNARHILLKPTFTSKDRTKAFNKLDSIKLLLLNDSLT